MFPLNTVLFPGVSVPLHVFEDRYRALVHHLLHDPRPRRGCSARGDPRGLRGRRARRAVAVPGRLRRAADGGRAPRGRQLRHRGRRPAAAAPRRPRHLGSVPGRRRGAARRSARRRATTPPRRRPGARHLQGLPPPAVRRSAVETSSTATSPATRRTSPRRWPPPACSRCPSARRCSRRRRRLERLVMLPARPARGAAGDARDPVAAGHRGRPHPLVPQLMARDARARAGRRPRSR